MTPQVGGRHPVHDCGCEWMGLWVVVARRGARLAALPGASLPISSVDGLPHVRAYCSTAAAGIVLFELFHRLAAALPDEGSGAAGPSPLSVLPLLAQEIAQARVAVVYLHALFSWGFAVRIRCTPLCRVHIFFVPPAAGGGRGAGGADGGHADPPPAAPAALAWRLCQPGECPQRCGAPRWLLSVAHQTCCCCLPFPAR